MAPPAPEISFLPLGANLFSFTVSSIPLVLSLPSQPAYTKTTNPAYFGETIGRVANRIRAARINLNNTTYPLAANNGPNTLHGGPQGWGKQLWSGPFLESRRGTEAVRFELTSPDGDEGFPGTLLAKTWYLARTNDAGQTELEVEYEARFADDTAVEKGQQGESVTETAVNMTNHTAFSIGPVSPSSSSSSSSSRSIAGTRVVLSTNLRQEVDDQAIPTGSITPHPAVTVGEEIVLGPTDPVFDDCFVLGDIDPKTVPLDTRSGDMRRLVSFWHPDTKIRFEVESTEPAFQFYTGEFIDLEYEEEEEEEEKGGQKHVFNKRAGFCVEASRYIDAAGKAEWEGMVKMKRGQVWGSRTIYRAWKDE
ncbi:Bifunctional protein gal10 [Sphaceloma murrayae]|uniref:Bifunctional protein gal10 n=1 Tax=Sphaceloma murrayae TaxID=2082308 RepID=A0A2K1R1Z6_9PEZI|nr:Bifunctional protein gal10 [Sphaceloma murrayae]